MPYFICVRIRSRDVSGMEVETYTLDDNGIIRTVYGGKKWVIRNWVYINEM